MTHGRLGAGSAERVESLVRHRRAEVEAHRAIRNGRHAQPLPWILRGAAAKAKPAQRNAATHLATRRTLALDQEAFTDLRPWTADQLDRPELALVATGHARLALRAALRARALATREVR